MGSLPNPFREVERESFIPDDKRKKVGNYLLGPTLGDGNFGKVRLGTHVLAREKVAVKILTKKAIQLRDYLKKNLRREAMMLQKISHPNIVHLFEVMETENSYYMVLELAAGRGFVNYLSERYCLDEMEAKGFMRQLLSAVDHIHKSGIVHRDLKLDNILLDEERNIKLIDFGLSNFFQEGDCLMTQCGSPAFTAPEVLSKKKYGPAVDVWTLGVDLYIMLTGTIPFEANRPSNLSRLYAAMLRGCSIPERLSPECQNLLRRMLDYRDTSRITVAELCDNGWITEQKTKPVMIVRPKTMEQQRQISEDIVCFILKNVKISDRELTLALRSARANSLAAMHDLLKIRLERGIEFPRRNLEENTERRSSDNERGGLDKSVQISCSTPDELIECPKQNICKKCTDGESNLSEKVHIQGDSNFPNGVLKTCCKCGQIIDTDEGPDSVLAQVLQFQKLLPMFQEIPYAPLSERANLRKGSECSDMVSLLNSVDEETFERALKLLRGYSSLPDPPTPPNSVLNGQEQDTPGVVLSDIQEEPYNVSTIGISGDTEIEPMSQGDTVTQNIPPIEPAIFDYKDGTLFSPKQLFSLTSGEVKLTYRLPKRSGSRDRTKNPGIAAPLNFLPPIEMNSGPGRPRFEPRERQPLTVSTDTKSTQKANDTSPRRSIHGGKEADSNIWPSSSLKPSSRQELPALQPLLRHSIGGHEQFGLKFIPRKRLSKDDLALSRKTTR